MEIPRPQTKTWGFLWTPLEISGVFRNLWFFWGHLQLDSFMEECNDVLFLPLPLFREHHETFLPHLVSTTCKWTPFQVQLEGVLNGLYQKQPSIGVLRKMCSENMHAANFIYRRTPMPKCNLLNSLWNECSPTNLLHIFKTPFPNDTSITAASTVFPQYQINPFLCESKVNLIHNCCFFAKYVLFVFCLLQLKSSLHYFHQCVVFSYLKYLTAMQWFLVGHM